MCIQKIKNADQLMDDTKYSVKWKNNKLTRRKKLTKYIFNIRKLLKNQYYREKNEYKEKSNYWF